MGQTPGGERIVGRCHPSACGASQVARAPRTIRRSAHENGTARDARLRGCTTVLGHEIQSLRTSVTVFPLATTAAPRTLGKHTGGGSDGIHRKGEQ